jgi:NADPH2:quinone reductase
MMKAIIVGDGGVLSIEETATPKPQRNEILIRVEACGVNRADLMQRMGRYPAPPGTRNDILGLEFAGRVVGMGEDCTKWKHGDAVMGIISGAAYAQYVVLHERLLLPIPKLMSMEEGVCIPEAFLTAYDALMLQLQLKRGDRVLVHAIGSGVGDAAYQLAHCRGISVVGTTRSAWKLEPYMDLEEGIVVEDGVFASKMSHKVDAVLDFVGKGYLAQNLKVLRPGGSLLLLGLLGGIVDEIPLGLLLVKRLRVWGSTLRSRRFEEKVSLNEMFTKHALPDFERGVIQPTLDRIFSWRDVEEAHRYMQENINRGKIVLRVSHDSSEEGRKD